MPPCTVTDKWKIQCRYVDGIACWAGREGGGGGGGEEWVFGYTADTMQIHRWHYCILQAWGAHHVRTYVLKHVSCVMKLSN